ncbi:MAG: phage head closure protein [Clostridiaceae bacterium]|nr:phage head closure protein [Clostridiaceae bacterium]
MIRNTTVNLIKKTYVSDEIGQQIPTATKKTVFADVEGISQNEFFKAGRTGLKPQYKILIWVFEYNGEAAVELDGKKYSVYRTFLRDDEKIELYLTEKLGGHYELDRGFDGCIN